MVDQKYPFLYNNGIVTDKEHKMIELTCANVPGGWQTEIKSTGYRFGPVFNRINDLWNWQRNNIFAQK